MKLLLPIFVLALSGCTLVPNSVRPEIEHKSHLTQHFAHDGQPDYGVEIVSILLHWDLPHAYVEIGEGVALDHGGWQEGGFRRYGEIQGPREQFTARAGLIIPLRK